MVRPRRPDEVRLDRLQFFTIVAPLVYIILLVVGLNLVRVGTLAEVALALALSVPFVAIFAFGVFRRIASMRDELVQRERRFRSLLESAPDATVIVDEHGRIVIANEQAEKVFGYSRDELTSMTVDDLIPNDVRPRHESYRGNYYHSPVRRPMGAGLDLVGQRKDGTVFPAEISLSPIETDEGLLVTSVVRDITARRQAEEERQYLLADAEAERERQRIGMDLHDGVIQSIYAVELSLEAAAGDVEIAPRDVQQRIDRAIEQLSQTIRDIRSYIFELRPARYYANLRESLENLVAEFRVNSLIDTRIIAPDDVPDIDEDRSVALFHIAQEALNNTRRHARASAVTVELRSAGGRIEVTINDNGAGFDTGRDFSEDHRGLHNMAVRARSLGGEVAIESVPGAGTTVRASMPVPSPAGVTI